MKLKLSGWMKVIMAVMLLTSAASASERFSIDGYYKNFSVVYNFSELYEYPFGLDDPVGSVSGRLRLNTVWWASNRVSLRVSYDFAPRIQDRALFFLSPTLTTIEPRQYRVADFDSRLYPECGADVASFAVFHNLDRAFVTVEADVVDVYIGRQPIAFGSARIVNPTDVIAPYSYETLDTEDRIGVDGVRARIPMGFMGEIDAGCVFGDDFDQDKSAYFLRAKGYAARTDLSAIIMRFRENMMVGVDVARAVGGASVWLEAAQVFVNGSAPQGRDYFSASVGVDYSFANNTYVFAEYHFNQAGRDDSDEYLINSTRKAYADGSVYLLGRHYLTPGLTWEFTPLVYGSLQILTNLSDQSIYLTPSVEYNVAENIYLSGGAFIGFGASPGDLLDIGSEFGVYPDIYHTSFRYYF